MSVILAIILGLVQGITEFLPISSSGHLSVLQSFFKLNYSQGELLLFEAMLHLGTIAAVCIVYRNDIISMYKGGKRLVKGQMDFSAFGDPMITPARQLLLVAAGTIPLVIALILNSWVTKLFVITGFIGIAFIINGAILFVSDKMTNPGKKTFRNMSFSDAVIIGLAQTFAVIPGISQSGVGISAGIACGLSRSSAMRFSMLLSIPAVAGAFLVSIIRAIVAGINWSLVPIFLIGTVLAAAVGFAAINLLRNIVRRGKFGKLAYYCWGVGALTILLSFIF